MGSSGKKLKHAQKMARKRAIKAARKSKYAALAGTSKKKKRQVKSGAVSVYRKAHSMTDCGNPGCKKCYPILNAAKFGKRTDRNSKLLETSKY